MTTAIPELRNFQHGFDVPVQGLGVTCRLGTKWQHIPNGAIIDLFECDVPQPEGSLWEAPGTPREGSKFRGQAKVIGFLECRFDQIPDCLLQLEHETSCRTRTGLQEAMERAYAGENGRPKFTPESVVTMLVYLRLSDGKAVG